MTLLQAGGFSKLSGQLRNAHCTLTHRGRGREIRRHQPQPVGWVRSQILITGGFVLVCAPAELLIPPLYTYFHLLFYKGDRDKEDPLSSRSRSLFPFRYPPGCLCSTPPHRSPFPSRFPRRLLLLLLLQQFLFFPLP